MKTIAAKLFLLFIFLGESLFASAKVKIGDLYYELDDSTNTASVTCLNRDYSSNKNYVSGDISIPSSVPHSGKTYNVTSIGEYAFYYCDSLTSISIPSSVTRIGDRAFLGCSSLTSIEIPSSVTNIGKSAFELCTGLNSIEIPSGVTNIDERAFYGCRSLTSIKIPSSVTSIGASAFVVNSDSLVSIIVSPENSVYDSRNNCNAIIETASNTLITGCNRTTIPFGVTAISARAFIGCSGLTSIEIPSSVTSIGDLAFKDCSGLASIVIPSGVTSLGYRLFFRCYSLASVEMSSDLISIGDEAFVSCHKLKSIRIPSKVTSINGSAFKECRSLDSIIVSPENSVYDSRDNCNAIIEKSTNTLIAGCMNTKIPFGVTTIGSYVFYGYNGVTSIEIPSSVTTIADYAFYGCSGLANVKCLATVPPSCAWSAFVGINWSNCMLQVPEGSEEAYRAADKWKAFLQIEGVNDIHRVFGDEAVVDVYTLDGALLRKGMDASQIATELPHGLYVINGRKVMVK
ncbi:MAG: leucine-rich repeat domain-containing protein [Bacteroidaceae bacterium]|nr:leucine-rich repeat domain-containing protein [Bacteroidaceae bacterium]